MAKINKYEPHFDEDGAYMSESAQGDYIKVSELRELLTGEINKLKGQTAISYNDGYINGLRFILAAIDTEVLGKKKFVKMLVDIHGYKAGNMFPVHQEIPSNDGTKIVYFDCRKYYFADDNKAYIDNAIAELVEAP